MAVRPQRRRHDYRQSSYRQNPGIFISLGIPATLRELHIPEDMLETMAKSAPKDGDTIHGVKPLTWQDVLAIYKLAY